MGSVHRPQVGSAVGALAPRVRSLPTGAGRGVLMARPPPSLPTRATRPGAWEASQGPGSSGGWSAAPEAP